MSRGIETRTDPDVPRDSGFVLARPQIEVALAEIRFSPPGRDVTTADALAVRDAARHAGLDLEAVQPAVSHEVLLSVGPEGPQSSSVTQTQGWQMTDAERQMVVTLLPTAISVQTNRYLRWSVTLRPALDALLSGVEQTLHPELRVRVGLRYVNRFADVVAVTPEHWSGRIAPHLLGPLVAEPFAGRVIGSQQQLELSDGPGRGRTLRHGCFRDAATRSAYSYLLDIDAFDTTSEPFTSADVIDIAQQLNRVAAATFRDALTSSYASELGLEPTEPVNAREQTS